MAAAGHRVLTLNVIGQGDRRISRMRINQGADFELTGQCDPLGRQFEVGIVPEAELAVNVEAIQSRRADVEGDSAYKRPLCQRRIRCGSLNPLGWRLIESTLPTKSARPLLSPACDSSPSAWKCQPCPILAETCPSRTSAASMATRSDQQIALGRRPARISRIGRLRIASEVHQYPLDDGRILDAGDDLELPADPGRPDSARRRAGTAASTRVDASDNPVAR